MSATGDEWVLGDPDADGAAGRLRRPRAKPPDKPARRTGIGRTLVRWLAFALWGAAFIAGVSFAALFAAGLMRDRGIGDAELILDLSSAGRWRQVTVREWIPGRYRLYLTTVRNKGDATAPRLRARIEVRVLDQDRRPVLAAVYGPAQLDDSLQPGVTWTRLGEVLVREPAWRPWTLAARTIEPDPALREVSTRLVLRRERPHPGIAGLGNYAAFVPAILSLAASAGAAFYVARLGGSSVPLLLSAAALGALIVLPRV